MKDKQKHTPGPWKTMVERDFISILSTEGKEISFMDEAEDEDNKNAALIAAAPELLEALKEAVLEFGCHTHMLACEQGECNGFIREEWRCTLPEGKCFVQRWLAAIRKAEGIK